MEKDQYLEKATMWAENKATDSFKAIYKGFEDPKIFTNTTTQEEIQADMSYITGSGAKHYSEIALKTENTTKLVSKWKLLSFLASSERGKLHLLAPNGHKAFTRKLIDRHNISAQIHSL